MMRQLKHILTLLCWVPYVIIIFLLTGRRFLNSNAIQDPIEEYGIIKTVVLYFFRILTVIPIPISICHMIGLFYFSTHPKKPILRTSLMFGPFLCFRVVTRGIFPELVKQNVQRNIETCLKLGLTNFVFEIATDKFIGMKKSSQVREVVVPDEYRTKKGTLYKARALQYCLEEEINILSDNDWIVHLDEETLLTENSLIGVINFINDGQYEFGQGVITYANEEIVNWITTLADSIRVGIDYGILRFSLGILHRPVFSWKGSFNICNAGAERSVTFDFGREGSIAEDCYFAMLAWKEGFKFGWVEGEMWEKSTFSIMDYIHQRKRWVQGINLVLGSKHIPIIYKGGIGLMMFCWCIMPFTPLSFYILGKYPLPNSTILSCMFSFMGGTMLFLFVFGAMKSFPVRGRKLYFIFLCFAMLLIPQIAWALESIAVGWGLTTTKKGFHIVNKEVRPCRIISHV